MEDRKTKATEQETLWSISKRVTNSRSLLDLVAEYLLSSHSEREDAERLESVLFAVKTARDEARAAELELYDYGGFKPTEA